MTLIFILHVEILSARDHCVIDVYNLSILICITDILFVHTRIAMYPRHRSTRVTSEKGKNTKGKSRTETFETRVRLMARVKGLKR